MPIAPLALSWPWLLAGLLTPLAARTLWSILAAVRASYGRWWIGLPLREGLALWLLRAGWGMLARSDSPKIRAVTFDGQRYLTVDAPGFADRRPESQRVNGWPGRTP